MRLLSGVQIGWHWWRLTPNTLASILPSQFPRRVPLTFWSRTFHISSSHKPSLLTMFRALHPKNSKSSAKKKIIHLTGAPFHPSTNGAAERLVQTFKQALPNLQRKPRLIFCVSTGAHRQTVDSLLASYSMVSKYARNWMQILPLPAHIMQG